MTFPLFADISSFQPANVDWQAYVAWSKQVDGVSRVSMRSSEGTANVVNGVDRDADANYKTFLAGARAAGIDVVIHYHYAYPQFNPNPADEASYQAAIVGQIPQTDVIMLDFEENVAPSGGTNADWALGWLEAQAKNYPNNLIVIYASRSMVVNRLQDTRLTRWPLILADWTYDPQNVPSVPAPWTTLYAWQFSDKLSGVPGFTVPVDANVFIGGKRVAVSPVLDLRQSYQLEPGETQDACGPWTASELKYAGPPGWGPTGTAEDVDQWADQEYTTYIGPNVTSDQGGSSIDNMHSFFHDAGNLHYWDIDAISPSSQQSSDLAHIKGALDAGYPVVVTVNELSVWRRDGSRPYPWQPAMGAANHIFTIVGYTDDGYFLVDDELNATDNWPDEYAQGPIELHWASIVQVVGPDPSNPWLLSIPSSDPTSWPAGFNARNYGMTPQQQAAKATWAVGHLVVPVLFPGQDIMNNSGIKASWDAEFAAGRNRGFAVTPELSEIKLPDGTTIKLVNWNGVPIIVQWFVTGSRCEWDGSPHWY